MELLLAAIAGISIGLVLGFIGAGGAMLAVPIMIYIFNFTPLQATTAALVVVGSAALSGALPKFRRGEVLIREALTIATLGLATNVYFAVIARDLPDRLVTTGLAIVLTIAGASMLQKPLKERAERRMPLFALIILSLSIGVITGLFGIGGGFVAIPILVLFYNTPLGKASGTALFIIFLNSSIALIARSSQISEVDWSLPIIMAAMAIVVSRLASKKSAHISSDILKRSFAFLLFFIAIFTLLQTWIFN